MAERRWVSFASLKVVAATLASTTFLLVGCDGVVEPREDSVTDPSGSVYSPKPRELTDRTFEPTPARLERGQYLVEGVAHCFHCHSERDWTRNGQPQRGKEGAGRHMWTGEGVTWLVAPNITPDRETGAGTWSDDMLARAIREGIGHDGRALFPIMPYSWFREMSDEDLASIIVYLRSLPPVRNALTKTEMPEEVKRSIQVPKPITQPPPPPNLSDLLKRGAYLVKLASCTGCHNTFNHFYQPTPGMEFAGGYPFPFKAPWGEVTTPNITPDPSGISYYDEKLFLQVMRTGFVGARQLAPAMPWSYFRNMTDDDLKAIFAYLRTVKPVVHRVDNTEPPAYCKVCGGTHGYGDRN